MTEINEMRNVLDFKKSYNSSKLILPHLKKTKGLIFNILKLVRKEVFDIYSHLSLEGKMRLLVSPNVCETLYLFNKSFSKKLLNQFENFVLAEGMRENLINKKDLFTSISDYCFKPKLDYRAIFLENGIILDYNGYFHESNSSYCYGEALRFKRILDKAFQFIEEHCPVASGFVKDYTIMISLFRSKDFKQTNFSSDIGIGKIHSLNFEKLALDFYEVVDFLVHESIHNYLHLVEEKEGEFLPTDKIIGIAGERVCKSPWSGRLICPQSYTHAVFVWYGLSNFWKIALEKNKDCKGSKKMYESSVKGFIRREPLSGLVDFIPNLDTAYLKVLNLAIHDIRLSNSLKF